MRIVVPIKQVPETADVKMAIDFDFTDTGRRFSFIIRHGVGEVLTGGSDAPDLVFSATEGDFKDFLTGNLGPAKALATGKVKFTGGLADLIAFRSYLIGP